MSFRTIHAASCWSSFWTEEGSMGPNADREVDMMDVVSEV